MYFCCLSFCVVGCLAVRSLVFFFFKQMTAYDLRISDWSSDVCSSALAMVEGETVRQYACCGRRGQASGAAQVDRAQRQRQIAGTVAIGRASGRERVCQTV